MPDLHLNTGAYALDALDDLERRAMERHLRGCADCTAELRDFHEATAMLADRVAEQPPEGLRSAVLAEISLTRQVSPDGRVRMPRLSWRTILTSAAAILIAFTAGIAGIAWQGHHSSEQAQVEADRVARVMADPGRSQAQGRPTVGGTAAIYASGGDAVLAADRIPAAPSGKAYQVWVIRGAVTRSAGVLDLHDGTGRAVISGVPSGSRVAMTVEPDGGSKQPTTAPILNLQVA